MYWSLLSHRRLADETRRRGGRCEVEHTGIRIGLAHLQLGHGTHSQSVSLEHWQEAAPAGLRPPSPGQFPHRRRKRHWRLPAQPGLVLQRRRTPTVSAMFPTSLTASPMGRCPSRARWLQLYETRLTC